MVQRPTNSGVTKLTSLSAMTVSAGLRARTLRLTIFCVAASRTARCLAAVFTARVRATARVSKIKSTVLATATDTSYSSNRNRLTSDVCTSTVSAQACRQTSSLPPSTRFRALPAQKCSRSVTLWNTIQLMQRSFTRRLNAKMFRDSTLLVRFAAQAVMKKPLVRALWQASTLRSRSKAKNRSFSGAPKAISA